MIDGCIIILIRYHMQLKLQLLNDSVFVTLIKGDVNLRLPYIWFQTILEFSINATGIQQIQGIW